MADFPAVLIVEDEQNLQSIFADYLQEEYRVLTASTFDEAAGCLSDDIDVVLLDRNLPKKSGDSLLPYINEHGTKVAMVTAVEPDFDIIDMDIDDYLTKPVSREELRDTVDELLTIASYDSKVIEYLTLSRKRAVLEAEKSDTDLEASAAFKELNERIETFREEADSLRDELIQSESIAIFDDL